MPKANHYDKGVLARKLGRSLNSNPNRTSADDNAYIQWAQGWIEQDNTMRLEKKKAS